jgi:uncharacterized protein YdaT
MFMLWTNGCYPAAYRNEPVRLRQKAVELANNMLMNGVEESVAIREGLRKARDFFLTQQPGRRIIDANLPAFP